MSNAEERALEAYPVIMDSVSKGFNFSVEEDINSYPRKKFQEGYQAAEEDMSGKLKLSDGSPWIMQKVENVFQELYDHYRVITRRNKYLEEENERIKSEKYKDEELNKMKTEYERMKDDYYRGFPISEDEDKKIREWEDKHRAGADMKMNYARFHYEFYPTPLGIVGVVKDSLSGDKFEFQSLG